MRLAVPFDHGEIYGHFGRTAQFKLYDLTDGRIVSTAIVDTMGNGHLSLIHIYQAVCTFPFASQSALFKAFLIIGSSGFQHGVDDGK